MDKTIEITLKACYAGQVHHTMPEKALIYSQENTAPPWIRIYINFAGPFFGKLFFNCLRLFFLMRNIKSAAIIICNFAFNGTPYFLNRLDNRPLFFNQEFNNLCELNSLKHLTIAAYHLSSNEAAERTVQTFNTSLKKIVEGKQFCSGFL